MFMFTYIKKYFPKHYFNNVNVTVCNDVNIKRMSHKLHMLNMLNYYVQPVLYNDIRGKNVDFFIFPHLE